MSKTDKMFEEMNDKLKLDNNGNMVLHINKEGGFIFWSEILTKKKQWYLFRNFIEL